MTDTCMCIVHSEAMQVFNEKDQNLYVGFVFMIHSVRLCFHMHDIETALLSCFGLVSMITCVDMI